MAREFRAAKAIQCVRCGKTAKRTGKRQKYCPECAKKAAKERAETRTCVRKKEEKNEWHELQAMDTPENVAICLNCPLPSCRMTSSECRRK